MLILFWLGQPVDGPQNGPAPGPWDIAATFREVFKNETQHHEVPHTAYVKVCLRNGIEHIPLKYCNNFHA